MKSAIIREKFLTFFEKQGHTIVPSSPLIPAQDPTILFANAGMNQFKDIFLGYEQRSYTRAASIQKCVRAGGKHNDLEQVGYTSRHLTFFEMMGNFSFGNYFKSKAIQYAWDFLTKELELDPTLLYPTVYTDDDESFTIWHEQIGVPTSRITRLGAKDNFWQMGDTGPCGPCTEILIDRGADIGCQKQSCAPGCDCPRFLEIWNLVFMEYDRQEDGTQKRLKNTGVDTGMGFERISMVMQDMHTVFNTDIFAPLITAIEKETTYTYATATQAIQTAFHVVADHMRCATLLIADGCSPSNDGRGYVLRKIIRRGILFAQKLNSIQTLLATARACIKTYGTYYPALTENTTLIMQVIMEEVARFSDNLLAGQAILTRYIDAHRAKNSRCISGAESFKLYDTYGFPLELTRAIAQEEGFSVDEKAFNAEMAKQKAQSKKQDRAQQQLPDIPNHVATRFVGYDALEATSTVNFVAKTAHGIWLATETSPFYVESGGQVSDQGWITIDSTTYPITDLVQIPSSPNTMAILVKITGDVSIAVGDRVHAIVDAQKRENAMRNHTATHLLQAALIQVLGKEVKQAGSVVHPDYLRFDYTYHSAMTAEERAHVEDLVNQKIMENSTVKKYQTTLDDAQQKGIICFFGEKYNPEDVRVVEVPGFSAELCGGTHVPSTGIIGSFTIVSDSALSSGTRRILALTGPAAIAYHRTNAQIVKRLSTAFKVQPEGIIPAVEKTVAEQKEIQVTLKQLTKKLWKLQIPIWLDTTQKINGIHYTYISLQESSPSDLNEIAQLLKKKHEGLFFLASKQAFLVIVTKPYAAKANLKMLLPHLQEHGIRGGGGPQQIQGAGEIDKARIDSIMQTWLNTL